MYQCVTLNNSLSFLNLSFCIFEMDINSTSCFSELYDRMGVPSEKDVGEYFPGGPVAKNPPSKARYVGLILDWETKVLHATGN